TWPVRPVGGPYGPAKVVADAAGRPGQGLNSLVSSGAGVHGGAGINTILRHGVVVGRGAGGGGAGLLDGGRGGRVGPGAGGGGGGMAGVGRAVGGVGAVIGDAGEIGFGRPPAPPTRVLASGLTIVPPAVARPLVAVAGAR